MFEAPLFLIAAALGAFVPLFLHLMKKRRSTPLNFPTLRFLQEAQRASSRRIRIEHFLLWLLRTLIMLLLGFAFAMPVLRARGLDFLGRSARDVAIVLDVSYSMEYRTGRQTTWDRAVEAAALLLENLGENDRVCVYLARGEPRPLVAEPINDHESVLAQVNAVRPEPGTSRLLPAIDAACTALNRVQRRRQREVHIITDNQAYPWAESTTEEEGPKETGDGEKDSREDIAFFVSLLGVSSPENTAPEDLELSPRVLFAGSGARLTASLLHSGPPRETTMSLFINEEEVARRSVIPGTPEAREIEFAIPRLPAGIHTARLETPADNLAIDNRFYFLLRVRDELPALIIGEERDTLFLRAALRAAAGGNAGSTWQTPDALSDLTLSDYSCIFLCNALPLSGQAITQLETFVRRGGLLVVFPGTRASVDDYKALRFLPGQPEAVRDIPGTESRQTFVWSEPEHPVLRRLKTSATSPSIALQRLLRWEAFEEGVQPLIGLSSSRPLLVERSFGEGRVLMFAVSADRSWSNLPLTPFYLPLVVQLVEYSAGLGQDVPFLWGRDVVSVETFLPDADAETRLTTPEGRPFALRSTMEGGQSRLLVENMRQPGIYRIAGTEDRRPAAAVNIPRRESDLTVVHPDTLSGLLDADPLYIATDRDSLEKLIQEHRVGRTYGELLLWIVLLLVGIEFIYANRLGRGQTGLGQQLAVASSGRVTGHPASGSSMPKGGS